MSLVIYFSIFSHLFFRLINLTLVHQQVCSSTARELSPIICGSVQDFLLWSLWWFFPHPGSVCAADDRHDCVVLEKEPLEARAALCQFTAHLHSKKHRDDSSNFDHTAQTFIRTYKTYQNIVLGVNEVTRWWCEAMWCSEADSGVVIVWSGDHVTWWWFELVTMWSGNELQWCYLRYYLLSKWWWCQVGIDWSADDCSSQTCNHFFMAPRATKERICRTPLYLHPSLVVSFEFSLHRILRYQQWICCCYCLFQVSQNALIALGYAMKKMPINDDSWWFTIPDRISLTEWKVSTLLQMVYIGSFCSYKKTPNQAFL